jgi:hypothetical protein
MIERNSSDCKYVEIFTHRVGSIGAPSRRTMLLEGQIANNEKPLRLLEGTRKVIFSKKEMQDVRPG